MAVLGLREEGLGAWTPRSKREGPGQRPSESPATFSPQVSWS